MCHLWGSEPSSSPAQPLRPHGWFLLLSQSSWSPWWGALGKGTGALLPGVRVPCGQSCSLYINSSVLGVSLHREGVRTVTFLSFACKSMSEARSLCEDNRWAESVLSPCLKLPFSS